MLHWSQELISQIKNPPNKELLNESVIPGGRIVQYGLMDS